MNHILEKMIIKYPELDECISDIQQAIAIMTTSYRNGGYSLFCGNGGSAADCEHIVGELMKGFMLKRPISQDARMSFMQLFPEDAEYLSNHLQDALPAISLVSHSALQTAFINDVSAEMVFAQQVWGYGRKGDVLVGLSTSGHSVNVVRAMQVAKAIGMHTIALTGRSGGQLKSLCDVTIRVPWDRTPDIQERHLPIYHAICIALEEAFFSS
jgi:phosphoheptose isomerase